MPTLNIGGQRVQVGDDFTRLSPEQQQATVDEIAQSLGGGQQQAPAQPSAPTSQVGTPGAPTINVGGRQIPVSEYFSMSVAERDAIKNQIVDSGTHTVGTDSSPLDTFVQGTTFGWGDEARGLVQGGIAALQGADFGDTYRRTVDESRALVDQERRQNPVGAFASEFAGAIPTGIAAGGQLVGRGAGLATRALTGAGVGAAQGAVYGAGASEEGDRLGGAAWGGGLGGVVGAAAPMIGRGIQNRIASAQQRQAVTQAARNAPDASQLRSVASSMFDQADNANIMVQRPAFERLFNNIRQATTRFRPNANLDPKATGALQVLQDTYREVMRPGSNVIPDLKDLHILRQAAQRAAMSADGRDATIAGQVIDQIDNFVRTLKPADIAGAADPKQASRALLEAISTWSRASKVGLIEEAIRVGELAASGPEKGVRNALRSILKNKSLYKLYTETELRAIRDVVDGTPLSNLAKLVGTFGFGTNAATNGVGGAAGMAMGTMAAGPLGMVAAPVLGSLGRKASERLTANLADRALGAVAAPSLPNITPPPSSQVGLFEQIIRPLAGPVGGLPQR